MFAVLGVCVCVDILGGLVMHKRARNHRLLVSYHNRDELEWLGLLLTFDGNKPSNKHINKEFKSRIRSHYQWEPQGKRESKKHVKGLLHYIPSTF